MQNKKGDEGEETIERWVVVECKRDVVRPWDFFPHVVPANEQEKKGPRLVVLRREWVIMDRLLLPSPKKPAQLIEAKCKDHFSWRYKDQCWATGMDFHLYRDYCAVQEIMGIPVWVLFLHRYSMPDPRERESRWGWPGCPPECPTGLFGESLEYLMKNVLYVSEPEDRESYRGHGKSGLILWRHDKLRRYVSLGILRAKGLLPDGW